MKKAGRLEERSERLETRKGGKLEEVAQQRLPVGKGEMSEDELS